MLNFLVVVFLISLLLSVRTEVFSRYIFILILQGLILFAIALLELKHLDVPHLALVLAETLVFKAIFIPVFLRKISRKYLLKEATPPILTANPSILIGMVAIVGSFVLGHYLHEEHLEIKYFAGAISAILIGFYIAINHKDILTHLVAYLIIENGIFLLSIALGNAMPMFVNTAILLDIFGSVLIMGIFFNKVSDFFQKADTETLSQLKD